MNRKLTIAGEEFDIKISEDNERKLVTIAGNVYKVDHIPLPDGRHLCLVEGRTVELSSRKGNARHNIRMGDDVYLIEVLDPRKLRGRGTTADASGGCENLVAPMPGQVVRTLVREGEKVEQDQGIVVLEAMKMENELRTSISGIVARLDAEEGKKVDMGHVVAVIEPAKEDQ